MKKLVFVLAFALGISATHAATATWSMSGLLGVGDITGSTAAYSTAALSGGIAYLFEGTGPSESLIASILDGSWDGTGSIASKTTSATGVIMQMGIGSYASQTVSMYAIVFDGATVADSDWYEVTTAVTQTYGATGNKTFAFTQANQVAGGTGWQAIPEPTSGMLLLVGGALLALKRKRA